MRKSATFSIYFFNIRLLSVLRGYSFFHPRHNDQRPPTSKDFYTRSYPLHYFLILILEKEPVFPFSMLSAKQGNYWYHFYNVFGIRGPWLGIEPRTSRTRCQHSTTRLSRRRYSLYLNHQEVKKCPITSTTLILTNENRSEFCACLIINIVLRR